MADIKKIAILTSGGDAPGMNAAVSAVIRSCYMKGITPYLVYDGYKGLVDGNFAATDLKFADEIIYQGGTAIGSARLPEFKEEAVRQKAVDNLKKEGIQALVVIGGDGSYMGAEKLTKMGINCIGLPGTIDNDIVSSDYTIGFFTALNTCIESVRKIRDTMQSHGRCDIVEVMGHGCGDLALYTAKATGAEVLSLPESPLTEDQICEQVKKLHDEGKRSVIVIVSELMYDTKALAEKVEKASGYVTRDTVLGHVQRGGRPEPMDSYLAINCGIYAVEQLSQGKGGLYVGLDGNKLVARDIESTLNMPRKDRTAEIDTLRKMNGLF